MSSSDLEQLRAAAIDGRTNNVRFRQKELHALSAALQKSVGDVLSAISEDAGRSSQVPSPDVQAEYYLAMDALKRLYRSLNFQQSVKDEYLIANGADNTARRVSKGIVVIRPTRHARFYSVVCTLATAITAGNCVVLEIEDSDSKVDRVLKKLLPQALDADTFYISNTKLQDPSVLTSVLLVDQTGESAMQTSNQLLSTPSARTIAIVHREADIESAAQTIVAARFSFQGTSPYSPDLVIVNDFIKSEFIEACTRHAVRFAASTPNLKQAQDKSDLRMKQVLDNAETAGEVSIFGSANFTIVEVHETTAPITKMKVTGCLPIMACTSLVDSIMLEDANIELLAVYLFADLPSAKFLAQHFNAGVAYVNRIPLHLLVGPAIPKTAITAPLYHKYSVEMFSSARPQCVRPPPKDLLVIDELLCAPQMKSTATQLEQIRRRALEPLRSIDQPQGFAIGFFEQGILLGAGLVLTVVIPTLAYGSWIAGRSVWAMVFRASTTMN